MKPVHAGVRVGPRMLEPCLVQRAQIGPDWGRLRSGFGEQRRPRRDQQADRVLHRVYRINEVVGLDEGEHVEIVLEGRPWGERHQRRAQGDSCGPDDLERGHDIGTRVPFLEMRQHGVAERFYGRHHEEAAEGSQLGNERPMLQEVLDLRRHVEGQPGELGVHRPDDAE